MLPVDLVGVEAGGAEVACGGGSASPMRTSSLRGRGVDHARPRRAGTSGRRSISSRNSKTARQVPLGLPLKTRSRESQFGGLRGRVVAAGQDDGAALLGHEKLPGLQRVHGKPSALPRAVLPTASTTGTAVTAGSRTIGGFSPVIFSRWYCSSRAANWALLVGFSASRMTVEARPASMTSTSRPGVPASCASAPEVRAQYETASHAAAAPVARARRCGHWAFWLLLSGKSVARRLRVRQECRAYHGTATASGQECPSTTPKATALPRRPRQCAYCQVTNSPSLMP